MIQKVFVTLLPVLATLGLGYFAGWERKFGAEQAQVLIRMVMLFALPMLLFSSVFSTSLEALRADAIMFMWVAIGMLGGMAIVFLASLLVFRSSAKLAVLRAMAISSPSVAFVGPPILDVLYPANASLAVVAGALVLNLVEVPLAMILLVVEDPVPGQPRKSLPAIMRQSLTTAAMHPVVWAPVLALALLFAGLEMPDILKGSFTLLGHTTGGVALFAVGATLYCHKVRVSVPIMINVLCKNILLPGIVLAAMIYMAVPDHARGLITVTLAIPASSVAVILAIEYKCGEREMTSTLFWSTILSVLTMGGFIYILG